MRGTHENIAAPQRPLHAGHFFNRRRPVVAGKSPMSSSFLFYEDDIRFESLGDLGEVAVGRKHRQGFRNRRRQMQSIQRPQTIVGIRNQLTRLEEMSGRQRDPTIKSLRRVRIE